MIACDVVLPQHLDKSNSVNDLNLKLELSLTLYLQVVAGDRVVVRVSDAIIPRFIVMYTKQT